MYNNEQITTKLEHDYQQSLKIIGEVRILGTFLIGPELSTVTILFPAVQDMAINCPPIKSWFYESENGGNRWIDIRLVPDLLFVSGDFISNIFITNDYIISPTYKKIFAKMKNEFGTMKIQDWMAGNHMNWLSEQWTKLFDHYLQFRDGVQTQILDSLTKTEEKALIFVLETIGDEGILSISEAIRQSGISRPVFTGLLDKLDRYKAAEIKNMGVKGTYINFYDHILSKFEIS